LFSKWSFYFARKADSEITFAFLLRSSYNARTFFRSFGVAQSARKVLIFSPHYAYYQNHQNKESSKQESRREGKNSQGGGGGENQSGESRSDKTRVPHQERSD